MTELSTVAGAIKALSFDRETQAYEQGSRFARNKLERVEVVTAAAQTIGADPSYEEWEAYRVQWVDGHAHQNPDLTANASDKAWKEFAKLLDELYGMTKPKSTGAAAVKKSEQREKAQEALLEKYEDQSAWELRDQLAKNYKKLADKPEDKFTSSPWYAEAKDSSDKALNKLSTAAQKYWLIRTFLISDIDPDEFGEQPPLPMLVRRPRGVVVLGTDLGNQRLFTSWHIAHDDFLPFLAGALARGLRAALGAAPSGCVMLIGTTTRS